MRPGLWSVPTVFPDNPLRYVLSYAMQYAGGIALVDTGWSSEASWEGLVSGLGSVGWSIGDVKAILVTHAHGDHYGLVRRIRQHSDAWVALHPADLEMQARVGTPEEYCREEAEWFRRRGGVTGDFELLVGDADTFEDMKIAPDRLLSDGDRPLGPGTSLISVWTPGHTPGHTCFYDSGTEVLLTGDHLLPRITPNISTSPFLPTEGLSDYLASLEKLLTLRADEVLPAHEYRFRGLRQRVHDVITHHQERLAEVLRALHDTPGLSTAEVSGLLHWSRPWEQMRGVQRRFAMGEAHAHLLYLERRGYLRNTGTDIDSWFAVRDDEPVLI
ncbi:glyoxylase-like metal-dependent hydrolase (beta-lactamase superfamily II) [Jatrophihabitans sp. GAS493]|nr:glyoxylase-like metal-dependent hydrolase (beta-lactamase superfamily II) [Jatrophihabitans sp. GAS493]